MSIEISAASLTEVDITYVDIATGTYEPGTAAITPETIGTHEIVEAPSASPATLRKIKLISISNTGGVSNDVYLLKGTQKISPTFTLLTGEFVHYIDGQGFKVYTAGGIIKA